MQNLDEGDQLKHTPRSGAGADRSEQTQTGWTGLVQTPADEIPRGNPKNGAQSLKERSGPSKFLEKRIEASGMSPEHLMRKSDQRPKDDKGEW